MYWVLAMKLLAFLVLCGVLAGYSIASDRETAEWVIREGGQVRVNGQRQVIDDLRKLPAAPFRLTAIDLIGTTIDPGELSRLAGLSSLTELSLPGPIFTPFSDSPLDANAALKNLAGLTHLERLFFSLHFLPTYNVDDQGVGYLSTLINLKELRLSQSSVKTPKLTSFPHLESLDLSDSPYFGDDGMATLESLKNLRRLYLRNTPITDAGLKHVSGLIALQELDLYGTHLTDQGIGSLRNLTAMRKLNLLGAEVTDASVEVLARMPHLQELNLYRSHVSNAGLAKLAGLKELTSLDVRYSRITESAIDAFRAAHPDCDVESVGGPMVASNKTASVVAGTGDRAVSDWVRRLGGKTEFRGDVLVAISLATTPVTDAQVSNLSRLTGLERLTLDATQISDLGLRSLKSLRTEPQ
jgi:Leucine-rich repeat (LRR) protein